MTLAPARVLLLAGTEALFSATTDNPGSVFTSGAVAAFDPVSATAVRTAPTSCLVSWTPVGSPPAGLSYDVTDGLGGTLATDVPATSVTVTVPTTAVTPVVKARLNQWLSGAGRPVTAACPPPPGPSGAPGNLSLAPADSRIVAGWTAAAGNGGTVTTSTVTGTPADGSLPTRTCTATSTSEGGTGPAASGSAVPYPDSVLTPGALRLWLDGADPATLLTSTSCTGSVSTLGTQVGCWLDKSPVANHATQPNGSARATVAAAGLPAPVPVFDGSNDQFELDVNDLPTSTDFRTAVLWGTKTLLAKRHFGKNAFSTSIVVDTHSSGESHPGSWPASGPALTVAEHASTAVRSTTNGKPWTAPTPAVFNTGTTLALVGGSGWYYLARSDPRGRRACRHGHRRRAPGGRGVPGPQVVRPAHPATAGNGRRGRHHRARRGRGRLDGARLGRRVGRDLLHGDRATRRPDLHHERPGDRLHDHRDHARHDRHHRGHRDQRGRHRPRGDRRPGDPGGRARRPDLGDRLGADPDQCVGALGGTGHRRRVRDHRVHRAGGPRGCHLHDGGAGDGLHPDRADHRHQLRGDGDRGQRRRAAGRHDPELGAGPAADQRGDHLHGDHRRPAARLRGPVRRLAVVLGGQRVRAARPG